MALCRPDKEPRESSKPASLLGLAAITRKAIVGEDLSPIRARLIARLSADADDACAWLDLSIIEHIAGRRDAALELQNQALQRQRRFSHGRADRAVNPLRLLALAAPGDFMANTPLEFLIEARGVALETLYVLPGEDVLSALPAHDVAFVAVAENDANQSILQTLAASAPRWPRPLINSAQNIARLTRDGAWKLLYDVLGVAFPLNLRVERRALIDTAKGATQLSSLMSGAEFPIIARPVGSHAGEGLAKIDDGAMLLDFLNEQSAADFYIAPFIDYRSDDGHFRKYRIALVDGVSYPVHMAISKNWMVHYLNADMVGSASNRAEEERFMAQFDSDFARRHANAFAEIFRRVGLDYLLLDCAETRDGALLLFETGSAMIVHSLDPISLFPYKQAHMNKIFEAFEALLRHRAWGES
jgi:hypothetical protein